MHDFLLKELVTDDIEQELKNIGFDKTYTHFAKKKFEYLLSLAKEKQMNKKIDM